MATVGMRASPQIFFSNRWARRDLAGAERIWLMSEKPENVILPPCKQPMNTISGLCSNSCAHDSPYTFGEKGSDPNFGKLVGRPGLEPADGSDLWFKAHPKEEPMNHSLVAVRHRARRARVTRDHRIKNPCTATSKSLRNKKLQCARFLP